jgi:hypothetical protein
VARSGSDRFIDSHQLASLPQSSYKNDIFHQWVFREASDSVEFRSAYEECLVSVGQAEQAGPQIGAKGHQPIAPARMVDMEPKRSSHDTRPMECFLDEPRRSGS